MLPKHYSAIHLLTMSPLNPKKFLITKLCSRTQQNTAFLCAAFLASTSVYTQGSLLSIPKLLLTFLPLCFSLWPRLPMFLNILITALDEFMMEMITKLWPFMVSLRHFLSYKMLFQRKNRSVIFPNSPLYGRNLTLPGIAQMHLLIC